MQKLLKSLAMCGALFAANASAQTPAPVRPTPIPEAVQRTLDRLREQALVGDRAYEIVESLTTEVGARPAGSEAEARARDWAVAMLRAQRFSNVRVEPFTIPLWAPVREEARVVSPSPQALSIVALGGSPSTPEGGIEAEVVRFANLAMLERAAPASVAGRIVFIDEGMARTMDGSGYGAAVARRSGCAPLAQGMGAAACIIRSVGTDSHRFPHQGGNARQRDGASLPNAALSNPDADQLTRLLSRGPVRMHLLLETRMEENAPSGNVIAEIRGRERPGEIVLIGAHLDSWTYGTGAIDDGAGVAIVTAAARLIRDLPRRPRRTIRIVLFGAEETGVLGGAEYARAHAEELPRHVLAWESDFGAGRIWRFRSRFGAGAAGHSQAIFRALAPLGVSVTDSTLASGGPDMGAVRTAGVPVMDLGQNGLDYFDLHHTADDTLDKIEPAALRQNVAAWAIALYLAAEMNWDFRAE